MNISKMSRDEQTDLICKLICDGAMCGFLEHYAAVLESLRIAAVSDALDLAHDDMEAEARILKNLANSIGRAEEVIGG